MRFATLSDYIIIIAKLAKKGPLKTLELQPSLAIEIRTLETALNFLLGQRVIKEMTLGGESSGYALTARGFKVLEFFEKGGSRES